MYTCVAYEAHVPDKEANANAVVSKLAPVSLEQWNGFLAMCHNAKSYIWFSKTKEAKFYGKRSQISAITTTEAV